MSIGRRTKFSWLSHLNKFYFSFKKMQEKFVEKVKEVAKEWFGENPEESPDLCRVVSDRHFDRLESLISSATGRIAFGKYCIFYLIVN